MGRAGNSTPRRTTSSTVASGGRCREVFRRGAGDFTGAEALALDAIALEAEAGGSRRFEPTYALCIVSRRRHNGVGLVAAVENLAEQMA